MVDIYTAVVFGVSIVALEGVLSFYTPDNNNNNALFRMENVRKKKTFFSLSSFFLRTAN